MDRTDAQTQKEQVRFMKITQNIVTVAVASPIAGRLCQTPWRFTETPYNRIGPAAVAMCFLICATTFAQNADNIADREVQRRQAAIPEGEAALARGKSAMRSKNYTVAFQEFKTAVA